VASSRPSALALYCRDEGAGPIVGLLHGVGADHAVWNAVLPRLAPSFRLLAPDLRGHGRSPVPPDGDYRLDALEEDVLGLLEAKRIPSLHLVGVSAGAQLALRLGLDAPDRVRSLTMIGGSVYTDGHTRAIAERWAETYARDGADALAIRMLKDLYYPDWIEAHMEFADRLREEVPRRNFGSARGWARETSSFDERGRIATLKLPTLVIQGMDDEVVDASHGRILRQSILGARLRILAQTGHMVPIERPAETAEAIEAFVREVESAPVR
jgi:pimeloyl-ACP methyl ester carboxylesterase